MNFAVIHQLGEVGSDHAPKFCDKYSLSLDKNVAIKRSGQLECYPNASILVCNLILA